MRRALISFAIICFSASGALAQSWNGYGANPQHTAIFNGSSQTVGRINWQAPLDDRPSYYGGEVLIHYASPMVTSSNTFIQGYRFTTGGTGSPDYDNWSVIGRNASTGAQMWNMVTDYSAPLVFPSGWTSVFPMTLCAGLNGKSPVTSLVSAGSGGSLLVRSSADGASSPTSRLIFYTTLSDFNANKTAYAPIKINTPLTADVNGNVFFGYEVTSGIPSTVSTLGTGGVAEVNIQTGASIFKSIQSLGVSSSLSIPATNSSPAVSNDGQSVYFALTGGEAVLVKLSVSSLTLSAQVSLMDPSVSGGAASLPDISSAAPMVGPDGHVFMGVFGNQWRESHGWMLQFDENLRQTNAKGKQYPIGAFGWDDTPSVVPAGAIPSYHGSSTYLILTKYNNYDDNGGDPGADGSNKVAVLDPSSNSTSTDRQSGLPVMNEALTILSPLLINNDPNHPNARYEWCINSSAVDVKQKAAIINCEDGHVYRWSFITNTITEAVNLQPPTGEAYTSTVIGPDGQIYAINNSIVFAVGANYSPATAVAVYEGTPGRGDLAAILAKDGICYSTSSVSSAGDQVASIEAVFVFKQPTINGLKVTAFASAAEGVTGLVYAYNFVTKAFVCLSTQSLLGTQTLMTGSTSANGSQFLGPGGHVRIVVRGILPGHISPSPFNFAADEILCEAN
jgi:hypothetical protein